MSDKLKQSRRNFLQNASLLGVALPFVGIGNLKASENGRGGELIADSISLDLIKGKYDITVEDKKITINADNFKRIIDLNNNQIITKSLQIADTEMLSNPSKEFQLTFYTAFPNAKPAGLKLIDGEKLIWEDNTSANKIADNQPVEWKDQTQLNGEMISKAFKIVNTEITKHKEGVTRLNIRARSLVKSTLKDVSINLFYEIYEGHPAIRKWIEITNNSFKWLKIDKFKVDDIELDAGFLSATPFTPDEQGAESCIISFSNTDLSRGIIAASEIPSATRKIEKNGAMGYTEEFFEWVLGPSESFMSEPVIHYSFNGSIIRSISGTSTPLDRTIEGPFKIFLEKCIGMRGLSSSVPAPIWCSYTNFLVSLTDKNMREQADIAARIGFVTFQLDEGWATTPSPGGSEPDIASFPDFDDTCRYIKSKGLRMGLWISGFRSLDSKDITAMPDMRSLPLHTNTKRGYGMSFASSWRNYFANDMVYMQDRYGMSYVKQDLTNISKGDVAYNHDSRTKKESILRGLRGLLEVNQKMKEEAPEVWTQITHEIYWRTPGPAADIAALKYACAFHTTPNTYLGSGSASKRVSQDWTFDPLKLRSDLIKSCAQARQRFYDHRGLPLHSVEFYAANAVNIKGSLTTCVQDRQICSWLMGAPTVFAGDLSSLTNENIVHYRKRFDLLKRLQNSYNIYGYFQYSGVPQPTDTDWHWWGKLNNDGYGVVIVIRGGEGKDSRYINIPWAIPNHRYRVSALLSGKKFGKYSGASLQNGEIELALPVFGQDILELAPER